MEEKKQPCMFRALYGAKETQLDITFDVLNICCEGSDIIIPGTNEIQDQLFSDPLVGTVKHITIQENDQIIPFEPGIDVHYSCVTNENLFKWAEVLRKCEIETLSFAVQIVMCLHCEFGPQNAIAQIGMRFGVPDYLAKNAPITVVAKLPDKSMAWRAIGDRAIIVSGTFSMKETYKTRSKQIVRVFDIDRLRAFQTGVYRTFVFDDQEKLEHVLRHGAGPFVIYLDMVIVCCEQQQIKAGLYVSEKMNSFGFDLCYVYQYRNSHFFHVWERKYKGNMDDYFDTLSITV